MKVYLGADHRGFELKEKLCEFLKNEGYALFDLGNTQYEKTDDYPDFAKLVAEEVAANPAEDRGILICGSGVGVCVVANKFKGIIAATLINPEHAAMVRNDENANIACLPADLIDLESAKNIVKVFLQTNFSVEERHHRRFNKIEIIDRCK